MKPASSQAESINMFRIYSGDKCVVISAKEIKSDPKSSKVISFATDEELHREYKLFARSSKTDILNIVGDEEKTWRVFRSLFSYMEAAGGLVLNPKGELLMIYRNGHWDLPKGKMEAGESPEQTAVREVEEECGVKNLRIAKSLISTYHIFFQNKNDYIKRTYWFEMICKDSSKPIPQKEEGIREAKWMRKEEVKKVMDKVYPSLQEVVLAVFSPSL